MRIAMLLILLASPLSSYAVDNKCAIVGGAMEQSLFDSVVRDMKINGTDIQRNKTTVQVLNISPVSKVFAQQLAKIDSDADKKRNGKSLLQESDYFESYYTNGTKSITAKYTLTNTKGQRDIFIASSLLNNDECSVRFNGYLTLSREF